MSTLYLVGTPIGNLEDMTFRAVRTLQSVSLIAAEDTRHSGKLLQCFEIDTPMISYHGDSPPERIEEILARLRDGDVALISDAGMPGISDPGAELVRAARAAGYRIESVPGPSAVTTAAAVSGLVDAGFLFAGYPPRRSTDRTAFFSRVAALGYPVVFFESPHRLSKSLADLASVYPNANLAVCRELTKLHDAVTVGRVQDLADSFGNAPPPGEYVLVLENIRSGPSVDDGEDARRLAETLLGQGLPTSRIAREVARTCGIARSDAYEMVVEIKGGSSD